MYTWQENLVDPQRWNRYSYARNNPLRYVDPDGRELRIAGDVGAALAALQSTVPARDRGFIRAVEQNGEMAIDARAVNAGHASDSENFLAIRQIVNSPGVVELDASSNFLQMRTRDGLESVPFGERLFGFTGAGPASAKRGVTQVFVNPNMDAEKTARTTAHELRHARRYLLGQSYKHPDPSVNGETAAAAAEAARNVREQR